MRQTAILMIVVAMLAATAGYFLARSMNPDAGMESAIQGASLKSEQMLGLSRPDFTHSDVTGEQVRASDFDGQVWLLNFWASWCAPCVKEMPMLAEIQSQYSDHDLKIVGIAIDDPEKAREFVAGMDLNYAVLVGLADVAITGRKYGNQGGMLPYSVLIDKDGIIRWIKLGELKADELKLEITALL